MFDPTNPRTLTSRTDFDQARRHTLSAWQRVIGAGPATTQRLGATDQLTVTGSYEGIPVRVSTMVDAATGCQGHQEAAA